MIHRSDPLDFTILTAPSFIIDYCDHLVRFSIGAILNWIFSQMEFFSIGSFLNLIFSQLDLFSIESFWGRHRQLDDSLVGQLTSKNGFKCASS